MKVSRIITLVAVSALMAVSAQAKKPKLPTEVKMSKEVLKDKIHGGWAGQVIGCTYGGPTEFRYATMIFDKVDIPWHEHICKQWYDNSPGLYDDVYMDLTFVDVFQKKGLDAPIEEFANAFAYAGYSLWHANLQGRYNITQGIMPPASGHWENNAHADDIDFQIEADYAGLMAPGMINSASYYCDEIGHMMNYGDGWYGGVYMAAMYSLAFVCDDMEFVVSEALKAIPEQSRFYKAMADVIKWHKQYPEDWTLCWAKVQKEHCFDVGCPEGVNAPYNIDAVLNSAYVIIGLLYGEKNFYRTIDISCRCGADSDCNPASAAGILGTMVGYSNIPDYWKTPLVEVADRNFKYTDISLNKATQYSFEQALQVIERGEGKVLDNDVVIKVQKPQAVRFEQCFEGHWPGNTIKLGKYLENVGEIKFNGNGLVVRYHFQDQKNFYGSKYVAEVECYVDGVLSKTMKLPAGGNAQTRELFYQYNMPVGPHTVTFKWVNKEDQPRIIVDSAIPYSDKLYHTDHVDE